MTSTAMTSTATKKSPFDLTGRTALVPGGNQGLGRAFAFGLAEAGATVAISGRSAERNDKVVAEAAADGRRFQPITADITSAADVARMTAEAIGALGHIDILDNNAGTSSPGLMITGPVTIRGRARVLCDDFRSELQSVLVTQKRRSSGHFSTYWLWRRYPISMSQQPGTRSSSAAGWTRATSKASTRA